jgi:hypothetical protein
VLKSGAVTMSPAPHVARGIRELRRLLRQAVDLRQLDVEGFRRWLTHELTRWQTDPAFTQRVRIRDLRRAHPELRELERAYRRAAAEDEASARSARLREMEEELANIGKALAGLGAALEQAEPEKKTQLQRKFDAFQARQEVLRGKYARASEANPSRKALLQAHKELQRLRGTLGLDEEETRLAEILLQQGQRSGHTGQSFEQQALTLTRRHLVPELLGRGGEEAARRIQVLRGVTLGAARSEFDQLVIRRPLSPGRPVEVLAMVEVKRNPNDLAHGFRLRQENLAWLTGDAAHYDAGQYRTRYFSSGHFDREAVHEEGGERFVFARGSFRRFRRESRSGLFLKRLYFITRAGTLNGVSAAALSRIRHRIATDERWQPESDAWLRALLHWSQSLAEPLEAPEVLRLYSSTIARARHVLVVGRSPRG